MCLTSGSSFRFFFCFPLPLSLQNTYVELRLSGPLVHRPHLRYHGETELRLCLGKRNTPLEDRAIEVSLYDDKLLAQAQTGAFGEVASFMRARHETLGFAERTLSHPSGSGSCGVQRRRR